MIKLAMSVGLVVASAAVANAEDWAKFQSCLKEHNYAAEKAEPSLFDGARLIVDVLCINEAAELANEIARRPAMQPRVQTEGYAAAFESGLAVIRRETTQDLFFIRTQLRRD